MRLRCKLEKFNRERALKLDKLKELFVKLAEVDAPAGFEEPMMKVLKRELEPHVDSVNVDRRGNVVGVKKGIEASTPSIALVAHMDQIGFIVSYVESRGFIRFRKLVSNWLV